MIRDRTMAAKICRETTANNPCTGAENRRSRTSGMEERKPRVLAGEISTMQLILFYFFPKATQATSCPAMSAVYLLAATVTTEPAR
jgi:hypothetical protein